MRLISEVRALYQGARIPILRVALGGALMLPAAGMMASDRAAERTRDAAPAEAAAQASRGESFETDPMARQWSEYVLERERDLVVASFAREFDISLDLATDIHTAAVEADIEPRMAFGLVQAESSFRTRAVSPVGAVGLTQLLPSTARWLVPGTTRRDLLDAETNLRVGFKYLRHLIEKYEGDERLALLAYNRGPGTVNRLLRRGRDPDNGYADKVLTGESAEHVRLMNAKFGRG